MAVMRAQRTPKPNGLGGLTITFRGIGRKVGYRFLVIHIFIGQANDVGKAVAVVGQGWDS